MKGLPDYSKRIYGLDVYRAIAILLVVHVHGSFMLNGSPLESFPWIRLTDGVELFFVLSGFLIGGILLKILDKNNYSLRPGDIGHFWKRRWYRTLPNYYLVLLLNYLFIKYGIINGDLTQFNYTFVLFLQNFASPFHGFFWESWSLSIEEWFYIILPISLWLVLKIAPSRKGILTVIILLIVTPLLFRISQSDRVVDMYNWDVQFRKVIIMRLDTIIYGVLAAYIKFYYEAFWKRIAVPAFVTGLVMILALPYIPAEPNDFYTKTFYFNLTSIAAMLMLPYADSVKQFRWWTGKVVTHISIISYSMYLVNLALVVGVIRKHFPVDGSMDGMLKYGLYWLIVVAFASLLYYAWEKPMMQMRERNLFKRKTVSKT